MGRIISTVSASMPIQASLVSPKIAEFIIEYWVFMDIAYTVSAFAAISAVPTHVSYKHWLTYESVPSLPTIPFVSRLPFPLQM